MRFYLIDAGAAKGPFTAEQLEKLPGFDAESMVCPVGATTAEDWKPAISFEPLKAVLFKPKAAPPPSPAPPPGPPCPKCRNPNPSAAVFCFKCGARIAGEPAPAPAAVPAAAAAKPPVPAPAPAMAPAGGGLKPGPGGMGRLASLEEPPAKPLPPVVEPRLASAPVEGLARWKAHIAAGAAVAAAFVVFFVLLKPKPKAPEAEPAPAAAPAQVRPSPIHTETKPAPEPAAKRPPRRRPAPEAAPAPAPSPSPAAPPAPRKRRRAARPLPAPTPAPAGAAEEEKVLDGLLEPSKPRPSAAAEPPAMPAAVPESRPVPGALNLPGIGQVVPKGAGPSATEPVGETPPPAAAPARPVQTAEDLTLESAKEQFDFCHALARQRAYGDFYDTCLCPGGRRASARQAFMEDMAAKPDAADGLKITGARLANPATAVITASPGGRKGKAVSQTWRLEDGLWCLDKP